MKKQYNFKKLSNTTIRKFRQLKVIDILVLSSLLIAFFFGMFCLYFHNSFINKFGDTTYYFETNTYFFLNDSTQVVYSFNPFAITSTIFISFFILISLFKWLNDLINSLYLIKLFGVKVIFDNPLLNQILVYFFLTYTVIWITICPNPYLLDTNFNLYSGTLFDPTITAGGVIFGIFYFFITLYIAFLIFNQIDGKERKELISSLYSKKTVIFGVTGSIGTQSIEVIKKLDENVIIEGCSFNKNSSKMHEILKENSINYIYSPNDKELSNVNSYEELLEKSKPNFIINALAGIAGLEISFLAMKYKLNLVLANKESLVCAGSLLTKEAKKYNVSIIPVDSEHTCLKAMIDVYGINNINELLLTCSGGPFYNFDKDKLENVTLEQALNHPTWKMGSKISIDSATLMNKTFEIIEAYWLFNFKRIRPIYHKQSIVHAMAELKNNAIVMYSSIVTMLIPIQLALNNFKYSKPIVNSLNFNNLNLQFGEIDKNKWESLKLADLYLNEYSNTTFGLIITLLDEIAIWLFEKNKIKFNEIVGFIFNNYNKFNIEILKNYNQIKILEKQIRNKFNYWNE